MATNFISDGDFGLGDRPAIGVVRQVGDDLLDAGRPGLRIADQNLLAAGLLHLRRETGPTNVIESMNLFFLLL